MQNVARHNVSNNDKYLDDINKVNEQQPWKTQALNVGWIWKSHTQNKTGNTQQEFSIPFKVTSFHVQSKTQLLKHNLMKDRLILVLF